MSSPETSERARRFKLADKTERWAVTMAKVGIRQAVAQAPWPRWHFATFCGPDCGEARGVVDLIAIRKDHGDPPIGLKRGDALKIVLIQVKGGHAAKPTEDDGKRLRIIKRFHKARHVILATWSKGGAAKFFSLRPKPKSTTPGWERDWQPVTDLNAIFQ